MQDILEKINRILGSGVTVFLLLSGIAVTVIISRYFIAKPSRFFGALLPKKREKGERTPLGSLCLALAGTLGVGNISGVAAAIAIGGAGAVFWMWISSIFCAALKFAETVLAVRYREKDKNGELSGGAHLYIKNGLHLPFLGVFFCVLCAASSFATGNVIQVNAAAQGVNFVSGIPNQLCGALIAVMLLLFCRSGSSVYSFTVKLIPALCLGYIAMCLSIICRHPLQTVEITGTIVSSAFTPQAGMGGLLGVICGKTVRHGITRGVMSNEAGCGTAPIAHASANVKYPAEQGILGVIETLFDTLILCSLTAYALLLSDIPIGENGTTSTVITAFSSQLGCGAGIALSVAMLLFALASAAGWNYYGKASLSYLGANKKTLTIYNFAYALCAFFGAVIPEGVIWQLSDLSIYLMSLINTVAVLLLISEVRKETAKYFAPDRKTKKGKKCIKDNALRSV